MSDAQRLQDDLALLTGMTAKERQDAIRWYARQSEEFRVRLMTSRFKTFQRLKQEKAHLDLPTLEYTAFLIAIKGLGWLAYKKGRTREAIRKPEMLKQLAEQREGRCRMLLYTPTKRERIAKKWGIIVECRKKGMGFRNISKFIYHEYSINVSHTLIRNMWCSWEKNRINNT